MSKIGHESFYGFSIFSTLSGTIFLSLGLTVTFADCQVFRIFGGSVAAKALLGTGGALIAAGLISAGIPKFRAILIDKNDETLVATTARKLETIFDENL